MGLIEKEHGTAEWRALHTGTQAGFDSIFGDEAPETELMSFADWVVALSPCFDPTHKGEGPEPAVRAFFRQRQQAPAWAPAEQSQAAAALPLGEFAGAMQSLSKTMERADVLAPAKAASPPAIGKVGKRAYQTLLKNEEAISSISTASPLQIAYALGNGISLASVPSALRSPDAQLFSTTAAETLEFAVQIPPNAQPLEVRDALRVLLLVRRESREQLISSGSLYPAFANRFPEVVAQLMLNSIYPGLHTEATLRKVIRNSDLVELADSLARGEFSESNVLYFAHAVAEATRCHLFRPGDASLPFSSCGHSEIILLDLQSQTLLNRCIDAFVWHAIGIKRAFSTWWTQAGNHLLVCLLGVANGHLYDAPLTPEALAKISSELRQILARVSEAVRQLSPNFDRLNLTELLGESGSNLLSAAKSCAESIRRSANIGGGATYDKISTAMAEEYYRQCLRASSGQRSVSIMHTPPSKARSAATPTRPGKLPRKDRPESTGYASSGAESSGGSDKSWRSMDESGDDSEGESSRSARKKPPPASTEPLYFPSDQDPITLENVNDARERSFRKGVLSKVAEIGTQLGLLTEKPGPNAKPCFRSCKGRSLIRKSDSKCRGSHFQLAGRGSANALRLQLLQASQMQYYGDCPRPPQPLASLQPPTLTFPPPAAANPANFNPPWATLASVGMPPGMPPQLNHPSELLAAAE